jgi:hypothetical protein
MSDLALSRGWAAERDPCRRTTSWSSTRRTALRRRGGDALGVRAVALVLPAFAATSTRASAAADPPEVDLGGLQQHGERCSAR